MRAAFIFILVGMLLKSDVSRIGVEINSDLYSALVVCKESQFFGMLLIYLKADLSLYTESG